MKYNKENDNYEAFQNRFLPISLKDRKRAIAEAAYFIAEQRGFKGNLQERDWHEAEKYIDHLIFRQNLKQSEKYASIMNKFYSSYDISKIEDEELAEFYINFTYSNKEYLKSTDYATTEKITSELNNVSILTKDTALSFLTKRSLLIAESTLLSHADGANFVFKQEAVDFGGVYGDHQTTDYYTNCHNLKELGKWLKDCKNLLISGDIFYYPKTKREIISGSGAIIASKWSEEDLLYDIFVKNRKIVQSQYKPVLSDMMKAIFQIELPLIDNVNMSIFSKISCDERKYLDSFRDFIREHFLELHDNEGNETFERNLNRVSIKIKNGLRLLDSDFRELKRKKAIQATGAIIGSMVATLVAIRSDIFGILPSVIGSGGGYLLLLKYLENNYSKLNKLKDSPFYYLWLLHK